MAQVDDLERRVKELEAWANRAAIQLAVVTYIMERLAVEQLADMDGSRASRIVSELTNPYTFNMELAQAHAKPHLRKVADASLKKIEQLLENILNRATKLRASGGAAQGLPDPPPSRSST